jgi:hypothetical protein
MKERWCKMPKLIFPLLSHLKAMWFIQKLLIGFHNQDPQSFRVSICCHSVILMIFFYFIGFTRNNNWTSSCGWTSWTSIIGNWNIYFFSADSLYLVLTYISKFGIYKWHFLSTVFPLAIYNGVGIFPIKSLTWSTCEAQKSHLLYSLF